MFLKVFQNLQSNKKTFEYTSLIFTEPWAKINHVEYNAKL